MLGWYRQYGVRECRLVDPHSKAVIIHGFTGAAPEVRRATGIEQVRSTILPGLRPAAFALLS